MSTAPTISVCVPVYNGARYLAQTLESALAQVFDDYEILVCDDGSTDETPGICHAYRDPRLRYVRADERGGQAVNFNRCLAQARGRLVTFLHADDLYLPGLLAARVRALAEHPTAGFACGAISLIDAEGSTTSVSRPWPESRLFPAGGMLEPLLHGCVISSLGLVVRRERVVAFRTDLTWGHDWEWELRLAQDNGAHYAAEALASYRVHAASGTADVLRRAENGRQERRILDEALARIPEARDRTRLGRSTLGALGRRHMYFAEQALLAGRPGVCGYNLRYAVAADGGLALRPTFWALLAAATTRRASVYRWYSRWRGRRPESTIERPAV